MYKRTEEHKKLMSIRCKGKNTWTKGKKLTEEHKNKIRESHLGKKRAPFSVEWKKKLSKNSSKYWKGKHHSELTKNKIREFNNGKKYTEEYKQKMSKSCFGINSKEKNGNWNGGITKNNVKIRASIDYRNWQKEVFKKDSKRCRKYGTQTGPFEFHHILNFSEYPELRFDVNNGITLSKKAHKEFHKKYGIKNNTAEQIAEFLSA